MHACLQLVAIRTALHPTPATQPQPGAVAAGPCGNRKQLQAVPCQPKACVSGIVPPLCLLSSGLVRLCMQWHPGCTTSRGRHSHVYQHTAWRLKQRPAAHSLMTAGTHSSTSITSQPATAPCPLSCSCCSCRTHHLPTQHTTEVSCRGTDRGPSLPRSTAAQVACSQLVTSDVGWHPTSHG